MRLSAQWAAVRLWVSAGLALAFTRFDLRGRKTRQGDARERTLRRAGYFCLAPGSNDFRSLIKSPATTPATPLHGSAPERVFCLCAGGVS